MEQGIKGGVQFGNVQPTMDKGSHKSPLSHTRTQSPRKHIGEPDTKEPCSMMERADQRRKELFKGITIGQNEARDAFWMVGNDQLADRPASIITNQSHLVQIERC